MIKLDYYACMMKRVYGEVNIPHPQNYHDKIKQLLKQSGVGGFKRNNSNKSFFSMVSRTNMSSSKKSFISEEE